MLFSMLLDAFILAVNGMDDAMRYVAFFVGSLGQVLHVLCVLAHAVVTLFEDGSLIRDL